MGKNIKLPPIQYNTYIKALPRRVYETLTTAEGWDAWFTQGTTIEANPGGFIRFKWVDFKVERYTCESGGPVLQARPNEKFDFQWTPGDSTTTVEFTLEARGPGTVVKVIESGHTTSQKDLQALVECSAGWGEALTLLKFYLEHNVTYGPVPHDAEKEKR